MDALTRDTLIRDVLTSHPESTSVFEAHGLGCPACIAADMETLSAVATMHDIDLQVLIDDLNALVPTKEA